MVEDLIKLMVERWSLPEEQVRAFILSSFPAETGALSLEQIRQATGSILQDVVLQSLSKNEGPGAEA